MMREFVRKGKGVWLALAVCLFLGLGFMAAAMPALADEAAAGQGQTAEDPTYTNKPDAVPLEQPALFAFERVGEHTDHPICGASCYGHDENHDSDTWEPWPEDGPAPTKAGNFYLTQDVTLSEAWTPADGTALCLNGHTLSSNSGTVIKLADSDITFTLTDCIGNGFIDANKPVELSGTNQLVFNMYGGTLTNSFEANFITYGVYLNNSTNGEFNMYGGTIDKMNVGVRVMNGATFNMYGGTISNSVGDINSPDDMEDGGLSNPHAGVLLYGSGNNEVNFNMYGGQIINGTSHGVILFIPSGANKYVNFNMYGGEISGNAGAGFVARYPNGNTSNCNIVFHGGTITGNESGGVDIDQENLVIEICDENDINITGNTMNGVECNVYLVATTFSSNLNNPIKLPGTSNSAVNSKIGITFLCDYELKPFPVFPVRLSYNFFPTSYETILDWFISDEPDKYCFGTDTNGGYRYMVVVTPSHMHGNEDYEAFMSSGDIPKTPGNYYLSEDIPLYQQYTGWTVPTGGETILCLNGHTLTSSNRNSNPVITVPEGATLTLCDCSKDKTGKVKAVQTYNSNAVLINGGTLNMSDVELEAGSTVLVITSGGTVNMNGGKISYNGNDPYFDSWAVHVGSGGSTFNMSDGLITGAGTGVYTSGIINLTGGEITGNKRYGVNISTGTTATLAGVHIVKNEFTSDNLGNMHGIGVHVPAKASELTSITIGSGTVIKDNYFVLTSGGTDDRRASNMYLTKTFDTMTIDGELKDGTEIHIRRADDSTDSRIAENTVSSNENYFFSDVPAAYYIKHSGNYLVFSSGPEPPKIIKQPSRPSLSEGESPVDKEVTVEVNNPENKELTYQWQYYSTSSYEVKLVPDENGGKTATFTIPDLEPGTYRFFCTITNENGGSVNTYEVTIVIPEKTDTPEKPDTPDEDGSITIPDSGQPTAPSVPEGGSPVGKDLTVTVSNPDEKELTYQWYYNTENSTTGGTKTGGNSPTCTIPALDPGTYYFYCEITDEVGKTITTNTVKIVIPEKKGEVLNPGDSIETNDKKTEVSRDPDGGTVTIDKDTTDGGTEPDVIITLPEDNKTGEVTVDKETGEVTVPGGSKVEDGDSGSGKPDVTIGEQGGTVTPDGEVKIPEGGTANVGGETDPTTGNTTGGTTITGGDGGTTVTPNPDGTVDVSEGGSVKTDPESGDKDGAEITLPNGGNVDPDTGEVTPGTNEEGKQIAGVDTDGDGKVDTLIVLPGTEGGNPDGDTLKPNENGGVDLPGGTEIIAGGSEEDKGNGEGGSSVVLPGGGEVTPGGGVKPEGGSALTGEDKNGDGQPDTKVTLPEGGEIKGDGEGGLEVPGGTTVKNGEDGKEITIGDKDDPTGGNGGTLNNEGGVDLPEGGKATIDNGTDKPDTTVTGGEGGSTITPNPDGTTDVSGGTTVKTGDTPAITVGGENGENGGTIKDDGDIELPAGGSATIGGGQTPGGQDESKTTITVPEGDGADTTIKPGSDGNVEVPEGSKVKTETPGSGDGDNDKESTEITLPAGGSVKDDGEITPGTDDEGKQIAGVDTDGDGKVDTLIVLPGTDGGSTIKPNEQGGVDVPGGTELSGTTDGTGDDGGSKVVVGEQGGSVNNEGGVDLPKDGTATIEGGENGEKTEITAGENGGTVKPNPDGTTDVAGDGTKVQVGGEDSGKPTITVDDKGAAVIPDGNIDIKDGASVTVGGGDGKPGTTITAPGGKDDGNGGTTSGSTTVTPKEDGSVDVGQGGTVTTGGENGEPGTPITLPEGGNLNPDNGTVTPEGGKIATGEDTDGDGIPDTIIILPEDKPAITPGADGGITLPGGSTIQGGDNGPDIVLPEGSTIKPDGSGVQPNGGLTIPGENNQPDISVTLPEDGAVSRGEDGGLKVPAGTEIKQDGEDTPSIILGENGGTIGSGGSVTLPEDGSAKIDDMEIKTPEGGNINITDGSTSAPVIEINGIVITAPAGEDVTTDRSGSTPVDPGTVISKPGDGAGNEITVTIKTGNPTLSKDGVLTFPNGGEIEITKDGTTTSQTVAPGGSVDISKLTGGSGNSGGSSGSGGGSGSGSNVSIAGNVVGGKVSITPTRPTAGQTVTISVTPNDGYKLDKLTVTDKDGKNVELTKVGDNKYTFVMPSGKVNITPSFVKVDNDKTTDTGKVFSDVSANAWYAQYVQYVVERGLMNGYDDGRFGPNDNTTRAQIVTILHRAEGEPAAGSSSFTDVSDNQYYAKAVAWAAANGIVKGYSETQFAPNDNITREQLAAILYRYAQFKGYDVNAAANLSGFADNAKISEYAVPAMQWAVGSALMQGNEDGTLNPTGQATRAEVAAMLMRFLNK